MSAVDEPAAASPQGWLEVEREQVERALAVVAEAALAEASPPLREALEYALSTRGKRIRPIASVAAYRAASGAEPTPGVYRLACAVEMVHTYSLVHDDLPCMDDDDLRRGRPTVHRVHGSALATLAGAALLPAAASCVAREAAALGLAPPVAARLVADLYAAAGAEGMIGGQLMDLEGEARTVDAAELERIHRAKTGALLTAALRVGALAGGAGEEALAAVTRYGQALGLAFQIVDDVLDVTGDSAALGKTAGRDEALRKSSYPALHGVDGARALARARVDEARDALRGLASPQLLALAEYVLQRSH